MTGGEHQTEAVVHGLVVDLEVDIDPGLLANGTAETAGDLTTLFQVGGRRHDDHVSDLGAAKNAPKCVSQQWLAAQRGECFGHSRTKTRTAAGRVRLCQACWP